MRAERTKRAKAAAARARATKSARPAAAAVVRKEGSRSQEEEESIPTFPIAAHVIPACLPHGQKGRVEVLSDPEVFLNLMFSYADHMPHGTHGSGFTNKDGRFIFAFVPPPSAPPGYATVDVFGVKETKQGDAVALTEAPFTVALPGTCP